MLLYDKPLSLLVHAALPWSRLEKMVDDLTKKVTNQETEKTEKAKELDKVVKALVRKVLSLESDITDMKKEIVSSEGTEEKGSHKLKKIKDRDTVSQYNKHIGNKKAEDTREGDQKNVQMEESSPRDLNSPDKNCFNPSSCSSPKDDSHKSKKRENKEDIFKCEKCDYQVKKKHY